MKKIITTAGGILFLLTVFVGVSTVPLLLHSPLQVKNHYIYTACGTSRYSKSAYERINGELKKKVSGIVGETPHLQRPQHMVMVHPAISGYTICMVAPETLRYGAMIFNLN